MMLSAEMDAELAEWEELKSEVDETAQEIVDLSESIVELSERLEYLAAELEELLRDLEEKTEECKESAEAFHIILTQFREWAVSELPVKVEKTTEQVANDLKDFQEMFTSKMKDEVSEHFKELAGEGKEFLEDTRETVTGLFGKLESDFEERRVKVETWYEQTKDETIGRLEGLESVFAAVSNEFERTGRNINRIMEMKDFAVEETNVAMSTGADIADLVRLTVEEAVSY